MKNIMLDKKEDGYWLIVKAKSGKVGMICLNEMPFGGIIKMAFLEWAEEQVEEKKKEVE